MQGAAPAGQSMQQTLAPPQAAAGANGHQPPANGNSRPTSDPPAAPDAAGGSAPSTSAPPEDGPGNAVSSEDIQLVQNLIERCLQMYMTRDEVISILREQATIDPGFTKLVWTKLEEQNPEFYRCYYTRLKLKAQIIMFNHLLEQQVGVVQRMQRGWGIGGGAPPSSATSSGIPLFQGGGGGGPSGGGKSVGGGVQLLHGGGSGSGGHLHHHHGPGQDQVVPAGSGGDFPFNLHAPLDGTTGPSPLFGHLHMGSDNDLTGLGNAMPTPGELQHALFPPNASPLNLPNTSGGLATLPRNFSLSDLGLDGADADGKLHDDLTLAGLEGPGAPTHGRG